MAKAVKQHGRVYTPQYLVDIILDFGNYQSQSVLQKHVIDNSCGDGAFLTQIVKRYCLAFLEQSNDLVQLQLDLETYIHGIELDAVECDKCILNLNQLLETFGISNVKWDVINADTLTISKFKRKMDYIFGNPPYVRVHNLENSYEAVKKFQFAEQGMTDLFIVFFEIGFNMLSPNGAMCLITPSSWLSSKAGYKLRGYIRQTKKITGLIDLRHFQAFNATTYTLISRFHNNKLGKDIEYYNLSEAGNNIEYQCSLSLDEMNIDGNFYLSPTETLHKLRDIKEKKHFPFVSVKNGFATLADKIFIGDFPFADGTIEILKASTGKWSRCIFPYDKDGNPLLIETFQQYREAYEHLNSFKDNLQNERKIEKGSSWHLFGRTQAIKDVSKHKYAINTMIKDIQSIKLNEVPEGKGVYSGLYIIGQITYDELCEYILSEEFITYIQSLKNYKSGGYYTFASKDLAQYLNYKLSKKHGQSGIYDSSWKLF